MVFVFKCAILVLEGSPGPVHVIEVLEALVVDPELELVAVLHDVERVSADLKGVLERGAELLDLVDLHPIPVHLLLPAQVAAHQLDRYQGRVEAQLPDEARLRPVSLV